MIERWNAVDGQIGMSEGRASVDVTSTKHENRSASPQ